MANLRNQLRINVGFFLNQTIGYSRDFHFDFPELLLPTDLLLADFRGQLRVNRTHQGLLVNGEFNALTSLDCVRCLETYQQPLQTTFDELYAFSQRTTTEAGLILPEDGYIDLQPILREYILIELPISPLCRKDCRGLCPICGVNLNNGICSHQTTSGGEKQSI